MQNARAIKPLHSHHLPLKDEEKRDQSTNKKIRKIKLGGQCKSLKSTSKLLDVGSDVGSDHFGHFGISLLTSLNQQLFRNIAYVWYSWHFVISCICVFVYVYLCICVFDSWEYQF